MLLLVFFRFFFSISFPYRDIIYRAHRFRFIGMKSFFFSLLLSMLLLPLGILAVVGVRENVQA